MVVAGNGREALCLLKQEPFDLALLDIQMPEMDGSEAAAGHTSSRIARRDAPTDSRAYGARNARRPGAVLYKPGWTATWPSPSKCRPPSGGNRQSLPGSGGGFFPPCVST